MTAPPGFYGKLPSHGDFVTRRLSAHFVQECDRWLQLGLQDARERLGPDWLAVYLTSPVWRFAFGQRVLGGQAWGGVLMPSVDRVGRYFPLLLAAACDGAGATLQWPATQGAWYAALEGLALSTLDGDFQFDEFDAALCALPQLPSGAPGAEGAQGGAAPLRLALERCDAAGAALDRVASAAARQTLDGHSIWWTDGSPHVPPSLLLSQGLPGPGQFTAMLDGGWQRGGWRDLPAA